MTFAGSRPRGRRPDCAGVVVRLPCMGGKIALAIRIFLRGEMEIDGATDPERAGAKIFTPLGPEFARAKLSLPMRPLTNMSMKRPYKANRGLACAGVTIWASGGGIEPHTV